MAAPLSPVSAASMVTLALDEESEQEEKGDVRPQVVGCSTPGARSAGSKGRMLFFGRVPAEPPASIAPPAQHPLPIVGGQHGNDTESGRSFDEDSLLEQQALTPQEQRLAIVVIAFSGFDLLASTCLAGFAFSYAFRHGADSLYCLGIQALSHLFSSFVITLRFMSEQLAAMKATANEEKDDQALLLREQRRRDRRREQAFAVTMGIAMLVSCTGLLFKALRKINRWERWYLDHDTHDREIQAVTDLMAWWGFGGYFVQAVLRFVAAKKLRMGIAWHGFAVSTVSLLFFLVLGVAASYQREWSWKAEPVAAIFLVAIMMCESIRMLILHMGDVDTVLAQDPRA